MYIDLYRLVINNRNESKHISPAACCRPPFWQSKLYGEPFGEFNRNPPKVVAVNDPAALGRLREGG